MTFCAWPLDRFFWNWFLWNGDDGWWLMVIVCERELLRWEQRWNSTLRSNRASACIQSNDLQFTDYDKFRPPVSEWVGRKIHWSAAAYLRRSLVASLRLCRERFVSLIEEVEIIEKNGKPMWILVERWTTVAFFSSFGIREIHSFRLEMP